MKIEREWKVAAEFTTPTALAEVKLVQKDDVTWEIHMRAPLLSAPCPGPSRQSKRKVK